jgi:hypothetical protein
MPRRAFSKRRSRDAAGPRRSGLVTALLLVSMPVLLGLLALVLNLGWLDGRRQQLQAASDAAALAGVRELMDPSVLYLNHQDPGSTAGRVAQAASASAQFAAANGVTLLLPPSGTPPASPFNFDVVVGWVDDPTSIGSPLAPWTGTNAVNTVLARSLRAQSRGDAVPLWLGSLFGISHADVAAAARATVDQRVYGFRPAGATPVPLVPLLVLLDPTSQGTTNFLGTQDNYAVDPVTGAVSAGTDGIPELTLYAGDAVPGAASLGLMSLTAAAPDIGTIAGQIVANLGPQDLQALGGQFSLATGGALPVTAAPAQGNDVLTSLQQALSTISGQRRIWPLGVATQTAGVTSYQVIGFAAGRVTNATFASATQLAVVVEPCLLWTTTALTAAGQPRNPWIGKLTLNH